MEKELRKYEDIQRMWELIEDQNTIGRAFIWKAN
jgi:hypothetical protein